MHKAILKSSSEAQNSFWIKSCTGEDMKQFSIGPTNKVASSFINSLTRVQDVWWKTFWAFLLTQQSVHIPVWHLSCLKQLRQFLITSQLLSCHNQKQRNFVSSVDNIMKLSRFANSGTGNYCVKFYVRPLYSSGKIKQNSLWGYFLLAHPVQYAATEW